MKFHYAIYLVHCLSLEMCSKHENMFLDSSAPETKDLLLLMHRQILDCRRRRRRAGDDVKTPEVAHPFRP